MWNKVYMPDPFQNVQWNINGNLVDIHLCDILAQQ